MKQKKLMLLGGIRYLLPVIDAAHKQGYYVITADYLPDNIAHRYSDEYVNVSIVDKEAVLKVACEKEIDGIMSLSLQGALPTLPCCCFLSVGCFPKRSPSQGGSMPMLHS